MKQSIPERLWRQATGRVAHAWTKNQWIISHRRGSQVQPAPDGSWAEAAVVTFNVALLPSTAVARVGPARRQRAAESDWENEGGATQTPRNHSGVRKMSLAKRAKTVK